MVLVMRWISAILLVTFLLLSLGSSVSALGPSVSECAKDPELEGCDTSTPKEQNEQNSESPVVSNDGAAPSIVWNVVKLIFVLLFVLALIYGLLKFFNKRSKVFNKNRTMENLGGLTLAPNKSIQAVRIGDQVFVIGVGDSIEVITEITEDKTKQNLLHQEKNDDFVNQGFSQLLNRKKHDDHELSKTTQSSFKDLFEQQLGEMKEKRMHVKGRKKGEDPNE
ncbi:flagellar biosynthetic protein FliO [Halobacillus shinanisalinarum]|uniref:Flagellar biosynthetic protein FliO n=1 Tax=Halobacillus shinanisalinarum TaxID=2932258 RepID=A0ABY4GZ65_9BACI|nr:flagellar biosynthetic protein FliO [Halobacillus shinanisalinarum]UOQ93231.1 flagellar biosynthetic protein FliO [Halobacillus shinanisalinarum]